MPLCGTKNPHDLDNLALGPRETSRARRGYWALHNSPPQASVCLCSTTPNQPLQNASMMKSRIEAPREGSDA